MSRNDDLSMPKASFAQDRCPQDQCLNEATVDHSLDFAASVDADRRSRQIVRVLAWACLAAIASLSLVPGNLRPHSILPGQAEHFIAYAVAGSLLALAYGSTRERILGWLCVSIASGGFEMFQNFIPERGPSVWDALASVGGLTFGILLGAALSGRHRRGREGNMD